jgi:tetratricopeptide (TPR) repeat protein
MNLLKKISYLLLLLSFSQVATAQTLRAYVSKAEEAYEDRNFSSALAYYQIVLEEEPDRLDALYYGGLSAHYLRSYRIAEEYLHRIPMDERRGEYKMTSYWLATIKKSLEKFDEAVDLFDAYAASDVANDDTRRRAKVEIQNCQWAKSAMTRPVKVEVYQLPEFVNSYYSDYAPFVLGDTIYYTSTAKVRVDTYKKKKKRKKKKRKKRRKKKKTKNIEYKLVTKVFRSINGEPGKPIRQNSRAENTFTANMAINSQGNRMYYSVCEQFNNGQDFRCDLYYRERMPGRDWGRPNRCPEPVNLAGYTSTQPAVGWDEKTGEDLLFFVSDREGGKGRMDLYMSRVSETGRISSPVNLKSINTEFDELTPFFDPHTQVLYFSSDGRKNLGGYDIFKSKKLEKGWETPENMGYPVNTSFDDIYYIVDPITATAFIASNREGSLCISPDRDCNLHDIYQLTHNIALTVSAFNEIDFSMLYGVTVTAVDMRKGVKEIYEMGNDEYKFELPLFPGRDYKIMVEKEGYDLGQIEINTDELLEEQNPKKYIFVRPLSSLIVRTFNGKTRRPVEDLSLKVTDLSDNSVKNYTISAGEFLSRIPVKTDREYKIEGLKDGFEPFEQVLSFKGYESQKEITRDLFFTPIGETIQAPPIVIAPPAVKKEEVQPSQTEEKSLTTQSITTTSNSIVTTTTTEELFPATVYFDNGAPNHKTHPNTTYKKTYEAYLNRKPRFVEGYARGLVGSEREDAKLEATRFFDEEIKTGYYGLIDLSDYILTVLQEGDKVELKVEGYSSPLANSKYNEALAKRRIKSVMNHFKYYKNGVFRPYLGDELVIKMAPYGETKADTAISDNETDRRSSVYSPKASKERRVEVTGIRIKTNDTTITSSSSE